MVNNQPAEIRRILVFSNDLSSDIKMETNKGDIEILKWTPSLLHVIPPNANIKYILLWILHFAGFFKNNNYCAYYIKQGDHIISSLVCVPALFIWSFMNKNDLQIKNVFTHPSHRGKGLAYSLIKEVMRASVKENMVLWYMTHNENFGSIKICKKAGFEFKGYFNKKNKKYGFIKVGGIN